MDATQANQSEDLSPYQVHSRREILSLLRNIGEHKQLINMQGNQGGSAIVTSILDVDEDAGVVVLDCAQQEHTNEQLLASDTISFETALEQIRILFFVRGIRRCSYQDQPALQIDLPQSVVRLQRREFYRVPTPLAMPVSCSITIPKISDTSIMSVTVTLQNVSGGGLALIDEHGVLDHTIGRIYRDCRIDLPGGTLVVASLELRNAQEIRLPNGRHVCRLGCLFVDLPHGMMTAVQRYISKLEREQNARSTGRMG
ncbi:MAG: flagellar brake protein [Pseudomonadota bacterium]